MSSSQWKVIGTVAPPPGNDGFDLVPRGSVIYLHSHTHVWHPHGVNSRGNGTNPVYRCGRCGDIGFDPSQHYGGIDPDSGKPRPDTRRPKEAPDGR